MLGKWGNLLARRALSSTRTGRRYTTRRLAVEVLQGRDLPSTTWGDFNGDGFDDLAVGIPGEDVAGLVDAGGVNVIYGTAAGLAAAASQFMSQNSAGMPGLAAAGDNFGAALAASDFNGDGFDDLAIGVPGKDTPMLGDVGIVIAVYGAAGGLGAGTQLWMQGVGGILDVAEAADGFGATLASGDFDGDGFDDLAVGTPDEDIGNVVDAGAVNVIYGSAAGLAAAGNQFWSQDSAAILDGAEGADGFGSAVTTGDINGDGLSDLVVGVSGEDIGMVADAGAVHVIYGAGAGLNPAGNQFLTQGGGAEAFDGFGNAVVAGDFNGDGFAEVAVGVAGEDSAALADVGLVHVFAGTGAGVMVAGPQTWSQNSPGIADTSEASDGFGTSLIAADFNGDGNSDLAVGVPAEDLGFLADAGAAHVLYGGAAGLSAAGSQFLNQRGGAAALDAFGTSLAAGDFNGDGFGDIAVGVPGEDSPFLLNVGAVNVFYGAAAGLTGVGAQRWHQNIGGVPNVSEADDGFGV